MTRFILIFLFGITFVGNANADVPLTLHYNGHLTNAVGEPVDCPDTIQCADAYTLSFHLYTAAGADTAAWSESHLAVPIYGGQFHVLLGSDTLLSPTLFDQALWLGISINNNNELVPRQKVTSAPYAIRAARAGQADEALNSDQLGGFPATDYASQSALTNIESALDPVATEGLPEDLADGDDDTLATLNCAPGMIAKTIGEGWSCGIDESGDTDTTLSSEQVLTIVTSAGHVAGPHTTDTTLSNEQVLTIVTGGGHVVGPHTVDTDSLNALTCAEDEIVRRSGESWVCSKESSVVALSSPGPCDESATGTLYFDTTLNILRICDGTAYRKLKMCTDACPDQDAVACGAAVTDDCGEDCGLLGTGLSPLQCTNTSVVPCGNTLQDSCGNTCATTGTGLNAGQCDPSTTLCGQIVLDSCGNVCPQTGSVCSTGSACVSGNCVSPPSCHSILATDASMGDGLYSIDPDGPGGQAPITVWCDMDGADGWTLIARYEQNSVMAFQPSSHQEQGSIPGVVTSAPNLSPGSGTFGHVAYTSFSPSGRDIRMECGVEGGTPLKKVISSSLFTSWSNGDKGSYGNGLWGVFYFSSGRSNHFVCGAQQGEDFYGIGYCFGPGASGNWNSHQVSISFSKGGSQPWIGCNGASPNVQVRVFIK
jgi:hypothetical protein